MNRNQLKIDLLGTSFTITTGDDPEYIEQILDILKEKIQETRNRFPVQDPLKLSIITSLFLVEELMKQESYVKMKEVSEDPEKVKQMVDLTDQLIREIDQVMKEK